MNAEVENLELRRWLITIAVMLVTVMEVLDMTIVNVALPSMMGTLEATTDQITWVLTSYVVSSAILMPLTGYLVNIIGRKKLLLINIVGFLLTSILCGLSNSLLEIVIFRTLQGIFGASLVPLSQFILRDTFPPEQMTKAMAIWGIGIMVGPVFGPTLGGLITNDLNWRWVFYINIPVCILAFFMCLKLVSETSIKKVTTDWMGIALLAIGIGSLQIFLDRGNSVDWFSSASIRWLCLTFIGCLAVFIIRGLKTSNNIINLHLFRDHNFSAGCLMLTLFCAGVFGTIALQPILMENLMNYSADIAGYVMAPRGIASAVAMAFVPRLLKKFDARVVVAVGIACCAVSSYWLSQLSLDADTSLFINMGILQGIGMGLFFVPISTLTFATLRPENFAEAAGLFSFGRNLGISIGISLLSTLLTRESQINWLRINAHIQPFNPNLQHWLSIHHYQLYAPETLMQLTQQISAQSTTIGFLDAFRAVTLSFAVLLPLVFILKKAQKPVTELAH